MLQLLYLVTITTRQFRGFGEKSPYMGCSLVWVFYGSVLSLRQSQSFGGEWLLVGPRDCGQASSTDILGSALVPIRAEICFQPETKVTFGEGNGQWATFSPVVCAPLSYCCATKCGKPPCVLYSDTYHKAPACFWFEDQLPTPRLDVLSRGCKIRVQSCVRW